MAKERYKMFKPVRFDISIASSSFTSPFQFWPANRVGERATGVLLERVEFLLGTKLGLGLALQEFFLVDEIVVFCVVSCITWYHRGDHDLWYNRGGEVLVKLPSFTWVPNLA
jgi:hypothetical protein